MGSHRSRGLFQSIPILDPLHRLFRCLSHVRCSPLERGVRLAEGCYHCVNVTHQ